MIWDVPMDMRCKAPAGLLAQGRITSALPGRAAKASPSMACWLTAIGPGSRCAMAHFCYAKEARPLAMKIGRKMLELIAGESGFQSLLGLLPAAYRHAVKFVRRPALSMRQGSSKGLSAGRGAALWTAFWQQ